ncbi:hypothetical protein [Stenotrophomonas lactitubi]|uniref:hypothetical protein n=1 Tax=Stenotrophomonas lactitubi TaxID=2045214 RepID=UPI00333FD87C
MSQQEQFKQAMLGITSARQAHDLMQKKRSEDVLGHLKDFHKAVKSWLEGIPSVSISTIPVTISPELGELTLVDEICVDIAGVEVRFVPRFANSKLSYEISSPRQSSRTIVEDNGMWFLQSVHNNSSSQLTSEVFFLLLNAYVPAK